MSEVGARWTDDITVDEAAGILNVSTRLVRTLAAEGYGRKVGHVWVLDRDLVLALAERKLAS